MVVNDPHSKFLKCLSHIWDRYQICRDVKARTKKDRSPSHGDGVMCIIRAYLLGAGTKDFYLTQKCHSGHCGDSVSSKGRSTT